MHFVDAKGILTGSGGHCGMNIYRGCTHGCIYCDSRSSCYQFTHAFEDVGVAIQTKSDRILRDIDLLDEINRNAKCVVRITLTTYDDDTGGMFSLHEYNAG